jgi:hypothetical protein
MVEFIVDNEGRYIDDMPYSIYEFVEKKGNVEIWVLNRKTQLIKDVISKIEHRVPSKELADYISSNKDLVDITVINVLLNICVKVLTDMFISTQAVQYYESIYYGLLREFILSKKDVWVYYEQSSENTVKLKISEITGLIVRPVDNIVSYNESTYVIPSVTYQLILVGDTIEEALANNNVREIWNQIQQYI